jgi:SAM-dependent methyltransferase
MQAQEIPKSEVLDQLLEGMYDIRILGAAIELRLWEKVAAGGDTAEKIAAREGWDLNGTHMLLEAIFALKLLTRDGNRYVLTPEAEVYLLPGKPTYKGGILLIEWYWEGDGRLAQSVRSGKRPLHYSATTSEVVNLWIADYSRGWVYPESFLEKADQLWQALDIQAGDGLRILDVACGPAPRSLALVRQNPAVHLALLDWTEVLQTALKAAASLGCENQVTLIPGDLWSTPFGNNEYSLVYLGNVTHFFSPEENTRLLRKGYEALVPGGAIVVNTVARRECELPASVGAWLYAVSAGGGLYDFAGYKAMLENAGFTSVEDINLGPIKAYKP